MFLFEVWREGQNILPSLEEEIRRRLGGLPAGKRAMRARLTGFLVCVFFGPLGLMMTLELKTSLISFSSSDCLDASPLLMFASLPPSSRCLCCLCMFSYLDDFWWWTPFGSENLAWTGSCFTSFPLPSGCLDACLVCCMILNMYAYEICAQWWRFSEGFLLPWMLRLDSLTWLMFGCEVWTSVCLSVLGLFWPFGLDTGWGFLLVFTCHGCWFKVMA